MATLAEKIDMIFLLASIPDEIADRALKEFEAARGVSDGVRELFRIAKEIKKMETSGN